MKIRELSKGGIEARLEAEEVSPELRQVIRKSWNRRFARGLVTGAEVAAFPLALLAGPAVIGVTLVLGELGKVKLNSGLAKLNKQMLPAAYNKFLVDLLDNKHKQTDANARKITEMLDKHKGPWYVSTKWSTLVISTRKRGMRLQTLVENQ